MNRFLKLLISIFLLLSFSFQGWAQQVPPGPGGESEAEVAASPRKQLATIIFAGLAGSILGLSTLSFYGRPQDKLANIAIGFALGVVSGFVYVTYTAVDDPNRFYGPPAGAGATNGLLESEFLQTYAVEQSQRFSGESSFSPKLNYSWKF